MGAFRDDVRGEIPQSGGVSDRASGGVAGFLCLSGRALAVAAQHERHRSTFATVRLRTKRTKGCGSRIATLTMVFKLVESAAKRWHRLRGYQQIPDVLNGIVFRDGVAVGQPHVLEPVRG